MQKSVALAFLLVGAVAGALVAGSILSRERRAYFTQGAVIPREEESLSILVLGRVAEGQGGRWHQAPNLVDAIVLFYYRPETGVVNLISLPRDLYGDFGDGYYKLNDVYQRGAIESFLAKLPEITGIRAEKYLVVDAGMIKRGIDALGGIDIVLDEPVRDPVSGFRLEPGAHHLNGDDTVWLLRNRTAPEGDFFRERNQQAVIKAIAERYRSLSVAQKTSFLLKMVPELARAEANFSVGEIIPKLGSMRFSFNGIVLGFDTGLLTSTYTSALWSVPPQSSLAQEPVFAAGASSTATSAGASRSALSQGAYILIPAEGLNNYEAIRAFITERIR